MNRYLVALGALGIVALSGCAAGTAPNWKASGLAASFAAGRAFDRAQSALKGGDDARFVAAGRDFNRAVARMPRARNSDQPLAEVFAATVPQLVNTAIQLDVQAQLAGFGDSQLRAQAMQKYRAANAFLPAQIAPGAVDADTLNAIGYAFADRGTSRSDWTRALQLTRLSLNEWDRQSQSLKANNARRDSIEAARTVGPLDSNAWALFRLKRFKQARRQQERVMNFARANPQFLSAELPYHMAEIYRALGRDDDATREYQAALDLNPDADLAIKIDAALNGRIV